MMQFSAIMLTGPTDAGKQAWSKMTANFDKAGFPWREPDSFAYMHNLIFTGDIEGATNNFLEEHLSKPLAADPEMHLPRDKHLMAEIYADPRVAMRMAELEKEHAQMREQVREMMLRPEWN